MVGVPHVLCFMLMIVVYCFCHLFTFSSLLVWVVLWRTQLYKPFLELGFLGWIPPHTVTSHCVEIVFSSHSYSQYYKSAYILFIFCFKFLVDFREVCVFLLFNIFGSIVFFFFYLWQNSICEKYTCIYMYYARTHNLTNGYNMNTFAATTQVKTQHPDAFRTPVPGHGPCR